MRGLAIVGAIAASACGRLRFEPSAGDGGTDTAGGGTDTGTDTACVPASTWSALQPVPGPSQSTADDWAPAIGARGLEIYFHSYRASTRAQLWVTKRATTSDTFGAATVVSTITSTGQLFAPTITDDGLRLLYGDNTTGNFRFYESVRASTATSFPQGQLVPVINGSISVEDNYPSFTPDGLILTWASTRFGPRHTIMETSRTNLANQFSTPIDHQELDVAGADIFSPALTADGLRIYFSSTRTGGPGGFDVYTATRTTVGGAFGAATLVPELSSAMDDVGLHLGADDRSILLNYGANTAGGNADFWIATRPCL